MVICCHPGLCATGALRVWGGPGILLLTNREVMECYFRDQDTKGLAFILLTFSSFLALRKLAPVLCTVLQGISTCLQATDCKKLPIIVWLSSGKDALRPHPFCSPFKALLDRLATSLLEIFEQEASSSVGPRFLTHRIYEVSNICLSFKLRILGLFVTCQ